MGRDETRRESPAAAARGPFLALALCGVAFWGCGTSTNPAKSSSSKSTASSKSKPPRFAGLPTDAVASKRPPRTIRRVDPPKADQDSAGASRQRSNCSEAELAAKALARIGSSAVPQLCDALASEVVEERRIAALALAKMGPDAASAVDALTAALNDADEEVRRHAVRALGEMGPKAAKAAPALIARALGRPGETSRAPRAQVTRTTYEETTPSLDSEAEDFEDPAPDIVVSRSTRSVYDESLEETAASELAEDESAESEELPPTRPTPPPKARLRAKERRP